MRIIYKHEGVDPFIQNISQNRMTKGESVLVISAEKVSEPQKDGYDVEISDEALSRNTEVRGHEKAHMAVLGSAAASGIIYDTRMGPDGETIALGGKIAVDLSEVPGDPEATLRKANTIINAAYAPGDPSAADQQTAAKALRLASYARQQTNQEQSSPTVDLLA